MMASRCIGSSVLASLRPAQCLLFEAWKSSAARAFIVSPPPHRSGQQDLARRLGSGTDGLSLLRGNAGAMSTAMDENQAGGHALLR